MTHCKKLNFLNIGILINNMVINNIGNIVKKLNFPRRRWNTRVWRSRWPPSRMLQHSLLVLPRLGFHFKTFPNCSMQSTMPTLRALHLKSFCSVFTSFYSEHAHFESLLLLCWNRSHLPLHLCLLLLCRLSRLGWKEKVFLVLLSMSIYRRQRNKQQRKHGKL